MKLITKQMEKSIPYFDVDDPCILIDEDTTVHAHYFVGNHDIWVMNYNKEEKAFFGYVYLCPNVKRLMIFSRQQLEDPVTIPMNINGTDVRVPMKWERELYFKPQTLKEVIENEQSGLNKFERLSLFV